MKKLILPVKRLLFPALFFICFSTFAQETFFPEKCDSLYYSSILDSLKNAYPNTKNIPPEFELAFYTAVSHYPELKTTNIELKFKKFNFCMAARPAKKLFANRKKRVYRVYANIKKDFGGVLPATLKFNQKVGVIGHELAHILDYSNKSLCKLVGTGIGYLFVSYRRKIEKNTDIETIKHGMGWQLYDYKAFLLNHSDASEKYKKKNDDVYLNEKELKELIIENSNK